MEQAMQFPSNGRAHVRAILVGERIDTKTFESSEALATVPFAYRAGARGIVVVFRYGSVVLINLTPEEEAASLQRLQLRVKEPFEKRAEETAIVELAADKEDQIPPGGPILIKVASIDRLLLIADVLAKSVVLDHDEREVAAVFDIEPFARELARSGRVPGGRTGILRRIGEALLLRQHVSGYVGIAEKPDVLWDRPDLERLYARLEDEYELKERVDILNRKLSVIAESAQVMTDIIDTRRSLRLEFTIVLLIVFEIVITLYQLFTGSGTH